MSMTYFRLGFIAWVFSTAVPTWAQSQSATACVDSSYTAFLNEMDRLEVASSVPKGMDYLSAYGWIRATRACLNHAVYPSDKQQSVTDFRRTIDRLLDQFAQAITTDSSPPIYAMGVGAGLMRVIPNEAPTAGVPVQSGMFMLSFDDAKRLQDALKRRGFYAGPIDGALGEHSYNAIRLYQRSLGKPTTGVLSTEDLQDLL